MTERQHPDSFFDLVAAAESTWIKHALLDDDRQMIEQYGGHIVEEKDIGAYEMMVVKNFGPVGGVEYQLGISHKNMSIVNDQFEQRENWEQESQNPKQLMKEFRAVVGGWLQKYGPLIVGSHNPDKNKKYLRILKILGFKVEKLEDPRVPDTEMYVIKPGGLWSKALDFISGAPKQV